MTWPLFHSSTSIPNSLFALHGKCVCVFVCFIHLFLFFCAIFRCKNKVRDGSKYCSDLCELADAEKEMTRILTKSSAKPVNNSTDQKKRGRVRPSQQAQKQKPSLSVMTEEKIAQEQEAMLRTFEEALVRAFASHGHDPMASVAAVTRISTALRALKLSSKSLQVQARSLQSAMRNEKNGVLRADVLSGVVTADQLVRMSDSDLADPENKLKDSVLIETFLKENVIRAKRDEDDKEPPPHVEESAQLDDTAGVEESTRSNPVKVCSFFCNQ
jgi:hypothetical protein